MSQLGQSLFLCLCLLLTSVSNAEENKPPQLPAWQALEFEEKAFWATARSHLEVQPVPEDPTIWELTVLNSVVDNSEQIVERFDPATYRVLTRSRLSRGKEQRLKSYQYEDNFVVRERRNPGKDSNIPPNEWPLASSKKLPYPSSADEPETPILTSPYLLLLLAQQLQAQGEEQTLDVLVHTDLNFYRVRLTSGNGIPVVVDYSVDGDPVRGKHETRAVAVHASPIASHEEDDDFTMFGLQGNIILLFDRSSGLPVQVRGMAPRIGSTDINLKSVSMRDSGA